MHKVVVDTNIFISAVIKEQSNPGRVLNLVKEKKIELIVSPDILAEIETVLFYPRLKKIHQLEAKAIKAYLKKIELISQTVTPTKPLHIINKDPSDNIYLECAVEGQADFIVSGDRHLTGLETYAGIRIMDPGSFLKPSRMNPKSVAIMPRFPQNKQKADVQLSDLREYVKRAGWTGRATTNPSLLCVFGFFKSGRRK